ncbi:hypothetical protein [Jeotgalibaca porci]|uniref:hypothetical protein n=1 Tax=Jeotgalibaca porci TaxID=1868793 RepID=UPI0035A18F96
MEKEIIEKIDYLIFQSIPEDEVLEIYSDKQGTLQLGEFHGTDNVKVQLMERFPEINNFYTNYKGLIIQVF